MLPHNRGLCAKSRDALGPLGVPAPCPIVVVNGKLQPSNKKKTSKNSDPAGMEHGVTNSIENTIQLRLQQKGRGP